MILECWKLQHDHGSICGNVGLGVGPGPMGRLLPFNVGTGVAPIGKYLKRGLLSGT